MLPDVRLSGRRPVTKLLIFIKLFPDSPAQSLGSCRRGRDCAVRLCAWILVAVRRYL